MEERWGSWQIEIVAGIQHALTFIPIARRCLVAEDFHDSDPEWATALVYSHLGLHLADMGGPLTDAQQDEAERLARFLLDDQIELSPPDESPEESPSASGLGQQLPE